MEAKQLLRVPAVAKMLDVNPNRVYELAKSGDLPTIRVGKHIRIDPGALDVWIKSGGTEPVKAARR